MLLPEDNDSTVKLNLDLNGSQSTGLTSGDSQFSPSASNPIRVNFADPYQRPEVSVGSSRDPFQLDSDPFGERTVQYGLRIGKPYTQTDVLSLNVFGREMGYEQLNKTDAGRRLIEIAQNNRAGKKRGFLDALTDFSVSDLPFLSLFATVGKSVSDAVTVSDTMKKLQNGEAVSDDELIKTRLSIAENEYRSNGTWGAMVGDIIRAAPGFMAEFFVSGGLYSAARVGATKALGAGIHLGMSRGSKILAREATEKLAGEFTEKTVGKLGAKAFADLATDGSKDVIVSKVAGQLTNFMKGEGAALYKGFSDDAIAAMAKSRAEYEFGKMLSRNGGTALSNGFNKFTQWMGTNVSRGLMDFGHFGTEEATVLFTRQTTAGRALADAVGTFLVEAPIKGAMLMAPNQFVAKPLIGSVIGKDGRTVSEAQLSLQQAALRTGNKALMDDAESIAFGVNMLEYVSENTGRGLKSLIAAAGIGLEKAGVKGLVRPLTKSVTEAGGLVDEADDAVSIGGKIRKFITDKFGTRESFREKMSKERIRLAAERLGVSEADIRPVILANSAEGLSPELKSAIGGDVTKFVNETVDLAYKSGRRDLEYKSYARFAVANWMTKHNVGPETVMNLYEQMGYDGILGEMFEERYSDVVKGMLGLDDREEHDFFSNLKEAVKGLYPGWDQLTAEAVGFAMPMVSRAGVLRLQTAVGGKGKIDQIRAHLECIDDAMRHDSSVQMTHGQYLETHDLLTRRDANELEKLRSARTDAEKAKDENLVKQLDAEISTLEKVSARRQERHQKFVGSLAEEAKSNVDAMVVVPLLSNATLADDEKYNLTPAINSAQASEGLAGQAAIVEFAPELARRLYEAEAQLEGEKDTWYRRAAHKIIGIAGFLATGDVSMAASNPTQWTARDMGLSSTVVNQLKNGFKNAYLQARRDLVNGRIGPRAEMSRLEKEIANLEKTGADAAKLAEDRVKLDELRKANSGPAYAVPVALAMEEAQKAFATRAQQIMSANLAAHQLRSFSDGRMRDQAIAHVAANYREDGDERQYNYSVGQDGKVSFYKLAEDGSGVDESTVLTADEFYSRNKEAVDEAHKEIAAATVSLLTRGLTKSDSADRRLLNTIRMNADSELLSAAITDAAMHMIGQQDLLYRVRIDGKTPVAEVIRSQSVGQTNMKIVDYIATKDDAEQVDARAYESVAHSLGFRFDGSEAGYKARNEKIFRLAKLATLMRRNGLEFFSKAVVENEKDSRLSANGVMTLRATRQSDGTYLVDFGLKQDGSKDERPYATREEMVADLAKLGYNEDSARIVFTQSKVVESTDMFHMIRELGLGREYADLLREAKNNDTHPMLRTGAEGELLEEDAASALLRAEIAAAEKGRHAEKGTADRRAYERLWGDTGYMAIGEALLKAHGVGINTVSKYAGEFSDYDPKLYTVRLNAGRLSSKSADIYVSIDPSVNSDITSGVVNALLLNAYHFNARLLRNELKGTVSEFVRQIDTVVDKALADAKDKKDYELVNSLEAFRNLCTREVDRVQRGDDGVLRVQRGAGMTAVGFTTMASAFCLFRDQEYRDNPFLRAVAVIADDVRQLPAYSDFLNLVDLTLGGSGFLTEAFRNATKENPAATSQTGVIRLMTYASGDPAAFSKAIRKSLPGGMSYTSFLNVCMRRLQAMSKSGTPVFTEADKAELKAQAELAEKAKDTSVSEHFTFLGNLIGTVKGVLAMADNGKEIPGRFTDFMKEVAEDAKADPNTTEDQRKAINAMLAILGRKSTADASIEEYEKALAKVQEADAQAADLRTKLDSATLRVVELEKGVKAAADKLGGTSEEDAKVRDEVATLRAALDTVVAQRASAFEELAKLNVPGVVKKAAINAGNTGASWINDADVVENEEEDPDADITLAVGSELILDLPGAFEKAAGLENNGFLVNRGNVAREDDGHLMTRSQARLAANIVVRSVLATEGDVSESSVVERLRELFPAMVQSEIDDVTSAFRTLDDLRIRGRLGSLDWRKAVESGKKWTFAEDTKEDDSVSSDDFNDRSLSEYNSEAMADFLALAQRSTPETGRNLQGFLKLAKDVAREYAGDDPSALFLRDFLNPKLDTTLKTQAEHSAVHLETIGEFDDSRVDGYVKGLLAKTDGQPLSRRGAFILSYLSSLPRNARVKFGLLCANSVSASPVHLNTDSGLMENARRKSGGKVPESLVVDGFSVLVGKSASFAAECAKKLRTAMAELNMPGSGLLGIPTDSKGNLKKSGDIVGVVNANAKLVADVFAKVFGKESPLVSALSSSLAQRHRSTLSEEFMLTLAKSVTFQVPSEYAEPEIGLIETVASGLDVLAKYKGTLTRTDVASVFTAVFATDNASRKGLRMAPSTSYVTSPLLSFLSSFEDSLPETIMTAEIDQSRESKGSSVAVAPRDMIPLLARWLYADASTVTTVKIDGKDVKLMSFADACAKFFGVTDEKVIAECRQDATWPDEARTPICAKSISTSYNTREIYNACEKAYDAMVKGETEATCYWIPIYAGDHASSTLLQVPKGVDFKDMVDEAPVENAVEKPVAPKREDFKDTAAYLDAVETWRDEMISWKAEMAAGKTAAKKEDKKQKRPSYEANAEAACSAVGLSLMFTDTKRSAVSSLEAEGVGMIGTSVDADGNRTFGENRVHIARNWAYEDPSYVWKNPVTGEEADKNAAFLGSTFLRGYGAKALKAMAQDPKSSTLKAHIISTYGQDLFFSKSLCVSPDGPGASGEFLENSSGRAVMDYLAKFRGSDELSTDLFTDYDSYKIGPAASKALMVRDANGKATKVMQVVFDKLYDAMAADGLITKDLKPGTVLEDGTSSTELIAKAMKDKYGAKVSGKELDELVGPLEVVDKVRGDRSGVMLSEILPGAKVSFVEGMAGAALDLSYQENGAMAYTVANVSHNSKIPAEVGASPRNYEVDAMTMAMVLARGGWMPQGSKTSRTVMNLIADWGLVANAVYSDPGFVDALVRQSEALGELARYGENPNGQNAREELARQLWAKIRQESNLPLSGIDAPLVSCGAAIDVNGKLITHAKSLMQRAMMKGSELFSEEESRFYGTNRRMALCNVNVSSNTFRYGWFLAETIEDQEAADFFAECEGLAVEDVASRRFGTDFVPTEGRMKAIAVSRMFQKLREASKAAVGEKSGPAVDELKRIRKCIANCFIDHHGNSIAAKGDKYVQSFGFEDLFMENPSEADDTFDLSAVQCEGVDLVRNDATGRDHVFLGGTMFGLPRTPSYNGSMWLQTVRAGLPVTEKKVVREVEGKEVTTFYPGNDAMVSPDPYTNKILGCDHDGDKTKIYMFSVDANGRTGFGMPPSPHSSVDSNGDTVFDPDQFLENRKVPNPDYGKPNEPQEIGCRDLYLRQVSRKNIGNGGMIDKFRFDPETGSEEKVAPSDPRPGCYYKISEFAKKQISNTFVRCLFNMSRRLPTWLANDVDGSVVVTPRWSEGSGSARAKFLGGVASSPTKAFPVADKESLTKGNIGPEKIPSDGRLGTLGKPKLAADVSASAADAADARAMAVSMACTLHLAWMTGYYHGGERNLFGDRFDSTAWLRFMYHVDGLSNATFDDIKEQICGRLGWTNDMIDTVITEILVNSVGGGKLPTTDKEFAATLGAYSKDINSKGANYWMLKAASVADEDNLHDTIVRTLTGGTYDLAKTKLLGVLGIDGDGSEDAPFVSRPIDRKMTATQAIIAGLVADKAIFSSDLLRIIAGEVASRKMHNVMVGRLYHIAHTFGVTDGSKELSAEEAKALIERISKSGEPKRFYKWATKRSILLGARSFANSINYMKADPGNPGAAGKSDAVDGSYTSMMNFLSDGNLLQPEGSHNEFMAGVLKRMHAATRLAYDIGNGLQTIAARAVTAATRRRSVLFPRSFESARFGSDAKKAALARMLLRDSMSQTDRLGLEANAQQIPYLCAFFSGFGSLASRVAGTDIVSGRQMYDAMKAVASGVRGNLGTNGSALEFRRGIESMFEIMYELMVTSREFADADGDKAPAYLRSANDTAYGETLKEYTNKLGESKLRRVKQYGDAGTGLKRIMALFRANDDESVGRIKEMFGKIISGTAYSGSRGLENRNAKASCRTFSVSTKSIVRYVVELTGRTPPAGAGREFVLSAMDAFAGIDEAAIGNALKAELKFKESERMGRDQIVANMRKSNERYRVVLDAYAAAEALEARFGKDFEMTPAKMFGQFLPAYSLMTSRTLGAPTPNSPSFLNLLPSWYYSQLSDQLTAIDPVDSESDSAEERTRKQSLRDFMSLLIGTNFAPVNEYDAAWRGRETEGKKSTLAKKVGDIAPLIARAEKAVDETGKLDSGATDYGALGDTLESLRDEFRGEGTGEARSNPDYRNTLDIMSDDLFGHVIDYFSETGATQAPAPKPTKHDYLKDGAYDPKVAKVALAMGSLLGSWATVEYNGGTTFVIKGRLRGNAGLGKECVITVDASADGMTCETDAEVTALAESEAFAASLCACADIGTDAEGFMKLPLEVRKQFVRKFKMGAATFNKVVWSADGKGLATLVGAIKAPAGTSGTKIYHEYFHAMMRMFDQIGLLGDADKAALAKQFGKGKWDRAAEEKAAEAFRKWVEDNTNADAEDTRSVFRKIFDFLRGFFEALCQGFDYTGEVSDDTIFKMMVHGIAQASDARVAELAAGNEKLAKARADGDDIAVASILRRTFVLPRKDFSVPVEHQMKVASEGLAASLNRMLEPDSGANPEAIKSATAELAGQASEKGGEAYLATEPADPVEEALDKVTFPQVEANDFYRASNMIGEALVHSLKETGSWNAPLEAVIRRYAAPEWNDSTTEAKDRLTVLRGLRQAYASLNPEVARRMSEGESFDKELTDSLVFEAALRMYHSLDRSFVRQTGAVGGTGTGMKVNPVGSTAATSASAYQVSAWIVSSRPTAAASVVTSARERIAFLSNRAKGTVEQAEMKLHLDMMEKLSSLVDDPTHLMDFRYSQGMDVLNEVIGRLRSGTKRPTYDENGFMNAIRPIDVADPNAELTPENIGTNNQWSADHLATFLQSWNDADVQESLKLALSTAYQVAAMAKFFRELDTVPVTSADDLVFRNQMMRRHKLPPNVSVAEWMATQAIGDSNLSDNRGLVDYCDQSFFIANNVDAWLSSLVRKSFGAKDNIGQMLMAENHEYGALKSKIADLENFYSMMFGDNVEAGGEILKVLYHTGEFKMEDGTFIRKVGDTYVKFNNYGRETCKITMSERDLRDVDLYKKMLTAYACGQDRVITGVNDLHFDSTMSRNEADYTRERILAKWNGGRPTGQMNALEIALVRLTKQVHESILDNGDGNVGLWDRLVRRALDGMAIADRTVEARVRAGLKEDEEFDESLLKGTVGSAIYNSIVIDHLVKGGLCEGMNRSEEKYRGTLIPRYTKAVVTIGVDDINDMFLNSEAYRKLTDKARGWKSEEEAKAALDRDNVSKEFMKVYSDTVRFAKQHPWLTHGDGQYFNAFGTALPFWRGSGIFMYNAVRSLRDRAAEEKRDLTDVENVMLNLMSSENSDTKVKDLDLAAYMGSEEMLANVYGLETRGAELVKDIADGKFAEGTKNAERFGLVLSADATLSDVAKAIYDRCLDQVWRIQAGNGAKMKLRDAEAVIEAYENTRLTKGELFGGSIGLNDQQMFRRTGTLPANHQIGHRVHVAIDGLTNAMMHRATFANLLMTPAFDGAPVYYADPSDVAATTSGLPDEFWAQVARWWAEYNVKNGITYDAKLSGIANAKAIYKKLSDQRTANKGMIGIGDQAHKYTEIGKDDSEAMLSVNGWLVRNDDQYGYESSRLNALGGGEAMGYLKQFIQSNRVLGFGGAATRATLHRILSWSKSMSVSFSFFFPLATKWESPIGAVGAMATMASNSKTMAKWAKSNPELFAGIQKMFGGSGWITKDFLGFQDIVEMMDSNDPFLAEMKAWASALGITLSTSLVNPVEPTKSVMASDIRALKKMLRDKFGAKVAAKYGRIMDAVALRQGEKAFNYALNATKLACVAQLAMKLRHEATLRGKAFDPIRDLRKYSGYINAEIGGIDPLRYAWAHPMNRGIMNALMFSWQWTRGAWEAGGGGVLEDFLFGGHSVTRQEREYMMGRWARMFGGVMIGVPAMMQVATLALAKAMGGGDDGEWFTWNNEDKTKWTAFDLTPLLKAMQQFDDTKLGGMLKDFKKNGSGATALLGAVSSGILGLRNGGNWVTGLLGAGLGGSVGAMVPSFIPMYTGDDAANRTSRGRHYYMHFGKQGWEFFRWFDAAASQFFSKLSMPTQRLLEGFMGRSLSYMERSLPWDEMGQFERWLSPTTDSALFNLAQAFLPFSVGGIQRNGDAGVLPIFGPVQMGASQTNLQKRLEKALTAWAHNDRAGYSFGTKRKGQNKATRLVAERVSDILRDARLNGFDPEDQLNKALGVVATKEYGRLFRALPENPDDAFDTREVNAVARALNRIGSKKANVLKSIKDRLKTQQREWKTLPRTHKNMYKEIIDTSVAEPFQTVEVPEAGLRYDY